jgi:multidrug efflux pump subunit AcrA (membrane-fusion protein)
VKASITSEGLRVIDSGLEPGQKVIVEGIQLVRPNLKVKTKSAG